MRAAAVLLLALAGCATAEPADRIGRIYSYVRSDRDGAGAETIHVYRASRTEIGVAKMRGLLTAHFEGCPQE